MLENKNKSVYVIGYPKSGNTWLSRLIAEVTQSNILADDNIVNTVDNSIDRNGNYVIYKKHFVKDESKVLDGSVVYIYRDVRDTLVSGFYHNNRWCNDNLVKTNILIRWYFNYTIRKLNKEWSGGVGSWSNHIKYWTNEDVIFVQYEKLLENTENELRRVLDRMGISTDDKTINDTVANQNFNKRKSDFLKNGDEANAKFLRSGKSGSWKNILSSSNIKIIEKKHGYIMHKLGYKLKYNQDLN